MIRLVYSLALLLSLAPSSIAQDYQGKYEGHPNLKEVKEIAAATAEEAPGDLPKWLSKKAPTVTVKLVDAEKPLAPLAWPGRFIATFSLSEEGKNWVATIELPIDSLIHDPRLVEPALRRQIFGAAAARKELDAGVSLDDLGKQGLNNPLIDAMAAHWAGSLDSEINYGLSRHLEDEEKLMGLVVDLELNKNGSALKERAEGDLTLLMLAKVLAPKKDKKLGQLFESITRKQPLEQGLKKASGKSLARLNEALHKALGKHLDKAYPKRDRKIYRAAIEAYRAKRWDDVIDALLEIKEPALVGPNLAVFVAVATVGFEKSLKVPQERQLGRILLVAASRNLGGSPFAVEAQERLGHYFLENEDTEAAVDAFATLRDDFSWQPGVEARATKLMESVKRK